MEVGRIDGRRVGYLVSGSTLVSQYGEVEDFPSLAMRCFAQGAAMDGGFNNAARVVSRKSVTVAALASR